MGLSIRNQLELRVLEFVEPWNSCEVVGVLYVWKSGCSDLTLTVAVFSFS